jgi:hypothetical protein
MVLQTNTMICWEISDYISLTLGWFVEFPRATPLGTPQASLGFRGHLLTHFPHIMVLLMISSGTHLTPASLIQCNAMQCNAMQCNAMQCNAMQCNAMQCNAMQLYFNNTHDNTTFKPCNSKLIATGNEYVPLR